LWKILAYLRTLAAPAPTDPITGDAANGGRLFKTHCAYCHLVNGVGGRFGPDLSRIGASRTRATIERQIRGAAEDFRPGYEPVTLTTPAGRAIHAVKKNEDLFSIQIMDVGERIQGYLKEDMKEVKNETKSAMPAFPSSTLSQSEVNDLMAYLSTLRGR
jgi:putative heme-binding domain-containing protein